MRYLLHICAFVIDGIRFRLVLCMYTVLWFLSFFVSPASAQPVPLPLNPKTEEYFFEEVKLPGGTPIRDVIALQEDRQGFIWLAGKHGLFRYDGHDFKIFRHTPGDDKSIVDTELWSLSMLGDTLLCVGTTHGVSLIDTRTDRITNLPDDTEGNPVGYVSCFYRDDARAGRIIPYKTGFVGHRPSPSSPCDERKVTLWQPGLRYRFSYDGQQPADAGDRCRTGQLRQKEERLSPTPPQYTSHLPALATGSIQVCKRRKLPLGIELDIRNAPFRHGH